MNTNSPIGRLILATSIAAMMLPEAASVAAVWNSDADGLWSDATKWTGGVPNSVDAVADLSKINITANRTITLDGNFTASEVRFGDATSPSHDWFLLPATDNPNNTPSLDTRKISVSNQSATIGVPIVGNGGLLVEASSSLSRVFLTGANTYTGDTFVRGHVALGNSGTTGSLASANVVNDVNWGSFTIDRADFYAVPFTITNSWSGGTSSFGNLNINSGIPSDSNTGASFSKVVRQEGVRVAGRMFIENGASVTAKYFFFTGGHGIQNGGTVNVDYMDVGRSPSELSTSTYTLNGGVVTLTGTFSGSPFSTNPAPDPPGVLRIGYHSTGEVTINAGILDAKAIVLDDLEASNGIDRLTVNGGTVRVGGAGPGDDSDPTKSGSAIISKHSSATYAVNYSGGIIQASGNFLHAVDATLSDTNGGIKFDSNGASNVITITGVLSGTGGLTKIGPGTLRLKGAHTYTGDTTINGGSVTVAGSLSSTGKLVINSGTLSGAGDGVSSGVVGKVVGNSGGRIQPGSDAEGNTIGTLTMESLDLIGGTVNFDVNPTNFAPGGNINDLINVKGHVVLNGGTISLRTSTVPVPGVYKLITSSGITATQLPTLDLPLSRRSFAIDLSGNDVLVNVGGSSPLSLFWSGGLNNNSWDVNATSNWRSNSANDQTFFGFDSVTFDDSGIGSTVNLPQVVVPSSTTVNTSKDYTFTGPGGIGHKGIGPSSLTKSGSGTLTLLTNNTYAGTTRIAGGTLRVGDGGTVGTLGGGPVENDGTLKFDRSDTVTLDQPISGSGHLVKSGAGTLTLRGTNSYTGITRIDAGTLQTDLNNALSPNSVIEFNGGALDLMGTTQTIGGLKGASGTIGGGGMLTVNQSTNTTFGGAINRPFTKTGTGTLTLTGASTNNQDLSYLEAGALVVEGSLHGAQLRVTGGTLAGKGTVPGLWLTGSGTLAPGPGPGILTSDDATLDGGTFAIELNGTTAGVDYDQLIVDGFLQIGYPKLTIALGFDPMDNVDSFTLIKSLRYVGYGGFSLGSQGLGEGAQFMVGTQAFRITYRGGPTQGDVILFAIPEPGSLAALLVGCSSLFSFRRFRAIRIRRK